MHSHCIIVRLSDENISFLNTRLIGVAAAFPCKPSGNCTVNFPDLPKLPSMVPTSPDAAATYIYTAGVYAALAAPVAQTTSLRAEDHG